MDDKTFTVITVLLVMGLLIYKFVYLPLRYLHKKMFPKKEGLALKTEKEIEQIQKIQLFNISNIKQEFQALGMIEAQDINKDKAKKKLQLAAYELGADAVINVSTNIDNNVTGSVGSVATMPRMVSGKTSTVTTYHYEGTAVKLK